MRIPLVALLDKIRSSLWFIPALMVVSGAVLSFIVVAADRRLIDAPGRTFLLFGGGADGARAVLGTIASSMMTVTGVVFSITIVALTLASQQFGPRVLRNFMEDRGNQVVLGTFISTFVYCLLVTRTVIGGDDDAAFVPHLGVTGGVLLSILSLGVLIYFIHHVSTSIRAETIIARVAHELDHTIDRLYPQQIGDEQPEERWEVPPACDMKTEISSTAEGYLQAVDDALVMEIASKEDLLLRFHVEPGDFIMRGQLLLEAHGRKTVDEKSRDRLMSAFVLGSARTPVQDVEYPLQQLVQIAALALSPGVNDPFTAISAIDRL
ncbi:MAG TPA: DUF2254 domain-containing protein, partial [Thermoanaerobaculia bacterium]|nr:DUF2254 domain-containing protein [Thermoanaerobaculia bacterium]